ncbi:MAG: DUF3431 domain-containing protein [Candidatus Omnitrophica bacterium]|nr:DUF3431 domain-containing protein [Candidatus Omnitrophota bacterium]
MADGKITRELVVARYNEDIAWVAQSPMPTIVYNKGNELDSAFGAKYVKMENFGREGHTYLYHILKNWDNLADITIFTQGDPIKHSPDFLKLLNRTFLTVQPFSFMWTEEADIPPAKFREKYRQYWVDGCRVYVQYLNREFISILPQYFYDPGIASTKHIVRKTYNLKREVSLLEYYWKRIFGDDSPPALIPFSYAGIFSVPKDVIRSRDRSVYENCMRLVLEYHENGFFLERLWLSIFRYNETEQNRYLALMKKPVKDYDYYMIDKINEILFPKKNTFSAFCSKPLRNKITSIYNLIRRCIHSFYQYLLGPLRK